MGSADSVTVFDRIAQRYSFWTLFFVFVLTAFLSFVAPMVIAHLLKLSIDAITILLAAITAPVSLVALVIYIGVLAARHRLNLD